MMSTTKRTSIAMACAISMPSFGSAFLMKPSTTEGAVSGGTVLPQRFLAEDEEKAKILLDVGEWFRQWMSETDDSAPDELVYYQKLMDTDKTLKNGWNKSAERNHDTIQTLTDRFVVGRKDKMERDSDLLAFTNTRPDDRKKAIDSAISAISDSLSQIYDHDEDASKKPSKFLAMMVMSDTWHQRSPQEPPSPQADKDRREITCKMLADRLRWSPYSRKEMEAPQFFSNASTKGISMPSPGSALNLMKLSLWDSAASGTTEETMGTVLPQRFLATRKKGLVVLGKERNVRDEKAETLQEKHEILLDVKESICMWNRPNFDEFAYYEKLSDTYNVLGFGWNMNRTSDDHAIANLLGLFLLGRHLSAGKDRNKFMNLSADERKNATEKKLRDIIKLLSKIYEGDQGASKESSKLIALHIMSDTWHMHAPEKDAVRNITFEMLIRTVRWSPFRNLDDVTKFTLEKQAPYEPELMG